MRTQKILISLVIAAIVFLAGCVATPYYGGTGYYRGAVYSGYGYQAPYYAGQSYLGGFGYNNGGHRHSHRHDGYRPHAGQHGHIGGGHQHSGRGHWGGGYQSGHRGGHHHRR